MSRIFRNNKPEFDRRRVVRETGVTSSVPEVAPAEETPAQQVFAQYEDIIDAANAVLPYLAEAANSTSIYIPTNMPELRAAVARKDDNSPDGSTISFDLFAKTLSYFEQLRNQFSQNALSDLTGNERKDALAIGDRKAVATSGIDLNDVELWNSSWFSRFTLWTLLKQFAVNTIIKQTAPKQVPGTESPGYISEFIHSVGMGFIIDAANAEYAKLASEGNELVASFVETTQGGPAGAENLELSDLEKLAVEKIAESDYYKIMDYCMEEISGFNDASLVSWLSYANARGIRNEAVDTYRYSPQYTHTAPDGSVSKVQMAEAHLSALQQKVSAMNGSLTLNVQAAGLTFNADMLCCITRLFGNKSTETLKAAKQLLKISQRLRVNEFRYAVDQVSEDYTNFVSKASISGLLALLDRTVDKVVIKGLNSVDYEDEDYRLISDICPAFLDYSQIIFDSAERLIEMLLGMTEDVSNQPIAASPDKNPYARSTGHIIHKKWIDTALRLIDEVINVIDNGNCDLDENGRLPAERTQELVSSVYSSANKGTAEIPAEVIETYFPHMEEVSVLAPGGQYSFTVPKNGTQASSIDERTAMRQVFERCGKQLSDEELDRILKDTNGAI